jgi:predicted PurR-regulated permease PerM
MNPSDEPKSNAWSSNAAFKFAIQLLALGLLLFACFLIFQPFVTPIMWGIVLAITLAPLHHFLARKMGGRKGWAATLISLVLLLLIIVPTVWLLLASAGEVRDLGVAYRAGEIHVPPPGENVKEWPVIGTTLHAYWSKASSNLTGLIGEYREEIRPVLISFIGMMANTAKGILIFALSIVVSGILLAYAGPAGRVAKALFVKLGGSTGENMSEVTMLTVRSVVKGILGVSFIQAMMAGLGMQLAGVPFTGVWIVICLLLSIVQVGILPVSIGVIIYIWSVGDTLTAVLLTVWMLFVGVIDNVLKPILLGKGAPVPMLVVFIGTIGGFIHSGLIGLFTGSVLLSLGYKLAEAWLREPSDTGEAPVNAESGAAGMTAPKD